MDAYAFQAALYCEPCGEQLARELSARGLRDSGDSDEFPQGPYPDGGGEADIPQHCDAGEGCLAAEVLGGRKVGAFLENPLTDDGVSYVQQALAQEPGSAIVARWAQFYGIEPAEPGSPGEGTRLPRLEDTHLETWFERDRAHVALYDSSTGELLAEWWDDDVQEAIEDGLLDPRDLHGSAHEYVVSVLRRQT